jgi:hypothetical protein
MLTPTKITLLQLYFVLHSHEEVKKLGTYKLFIYMCILYVISVKKEVNTMRSSMPDPYFGELKV